VTCKNCRYFVCTYDPHPGQFGTCCVEPVSITRLADAPMCRHGMAKPLADEARYAVTCHITTQIEE
jgi:hypothetical protein